MRSPTSNHKLNLSSYLYEVILRLATGLVILVLSLHLYAGQNYQIIEKDGRKGLMAADGTIAIPAVYDELGWSDGSEELFGELIGFKFENEWGLVTTKNKVIAPAKYYRLTPWEGQFIKAAIKGKFSNHLFYGLIDDQGKVVLSCNYFDIERLNDNFVVSSYHSGTVVKGFINATFDNIIPIGFAEILHVSKSIYAAKHPNGKWNLYTLNGNSKAEDLDGFDVIEDRLIVHARGRYGLLSADDLSVLQAILYKDVSHDGTLIPYPSWDVSSINLDSVGHFIADSLGLKGTVFFTHINGNQEVIIDGNAIFGTSTVHIKFARDGFLIAQDQLTKKWSLVRTSGDAVIVEQDSIGFDGSYFFAIDDDGWQIFNRFGRKLSPRNYEGVGQSVLNHVPLKRNGYWALMDFQGEMITQFKFDSIDYGVENRVIVDYLGKKGVIDLYGDWVVKPSYERIWMTEEIIAAVNHNHWEFFQPNGKIVFSIDAEEVISQNNWIAFRRNGEWGILSSTAEYLADPIYQEVGRIGEILFGKDETHVSLYTMNGRQLVSANDRIQQIIDESEGLYKIKKDNRIGYIDGQGRLRIANRYEEGGLLSEDRIPIKIMGRWGYVDRQESIVIQPIFDSAGVFDQGVAIVKKNGLYGLIGSAGDELLACEYRSISHQVGRAYIYSLEPNAWGATDVHGNVTLTPNYLEIKESTNGLLMVNRAGRWGIINEAGYTMVPFEYDEIIQKEDYFLMKKSTH